MARRTVTEKKAWKPVVFPKSFTITLDDDALKLANFAGQRSAWVSRKHFVNSVIRYVMMPLAPPELKPRLGDWEDMALSEPPLKLKS